MSKNDDQISHGTTFGNNVSDPADVQDLPKLSGAKKLKRWAYQIRAYYQERNPNSTLLHEKDSVDFWVNNRVALIGDVRLPKSYPRITGKTDQHQRWAVAIRAKFADTFPESRLMYSQTQAQFWIENRRIFDFAILGYETAKEEVCDGSD